MSCLVLLAGAMTTAGNRALAQESATSCAPAVGRLVSLQGNVEVLRAGNQAWVAVRRLDTALCAGDRLRTDALSRALFFLQPETIVRVDQNTTITINQSTDEIEVQFFASELAEALRNTQSRGAGYFITRFPKKFKVSTPHMNAAIEGTEFMVELSSDATKLTVLEGKVASEAVATGDRQLVEAGQSIASGATGAAAITTVVKPEDAVQWVLRYPPLSDSGPADAATGVARAEAMLRVGHVDESLKEIDEALRNNPSDATALALLAVVQVAKNDKVAALKSARSATAADAANYRAWLALSYAQQASFELAQALESARTAQAVKVDSSLIHARVAELLLSIGDSRLAEESALASVSVNPGESAAHTILGFVHLAEIDTTAARADFSAAIERDSFDALPRLGMGLAMIRDGELTEGRQEIEIAVALDPSSSLLRSYVGKSYYEENTKDRDLLAGTQFDAAARLDPADPTPHLYEAIRLQTANRPVEALHEIRESIARNDNRAVYRSQLNLDEDLAVRSASQGRIYRDLGFESLALVEGWSSVASDPGDYSGHRLLADSYSGMPRLELARGNELFVSQLLQPLNMNPVPPQLGESNLFILDSAGPADVAFNEFNPLFSSDGYAVHASGTYGSNDTWGDNVALALLQGPWSLSLGQFHFETDGFRENNDLEQDVYNLFVQFRQSEETSFIAEARSARLEFGDLRLLFDPANFRPTTRTQEETESIRLGLQHAFTARSAILASLVYQDLEFETSDLPVAEIEDDFDGYAAEIQYIFDDENWRLVSGIRQTGREQHEHRVLFGEESEQNFDFDSISAYSYAYFDVGPAFSIVAGLSADSVEGPAVDEDELNPKLGVTWRPSDRTQLRAAATRRIEHDTYGRQDIPPRLEPTQVAGINQVFASGTGEINEIYGLGIDQVVSRNVFAGMEVSKRDLEIPVLVTGPPDEIQVFKADEISGRAYLNWTLSSRLALSATYRYDERENDFGASLQFGTTELRTHRVPVALRYFHPSGLALEATATYVDQEGEFLQFVPVPPFFLPVSGSDRFWTLDAAIRYRLPRRTGIIAITAENLFDEEFRFQDVDPENPEIVADRFVSIKVTIAF